MLSLQGSLAAQKKEFEEKEEQMKQNIAALQVLAEKSHQEKERLEIQLKEASESHGTSEKIEDQPTKRDSLLDSLAPLLGLSVNADEEPEQANALLVEKITAMISEASDLRSTVSSLESGKQEVPFPCHCSFSPWRFHSPHLCLV